MRDAIRGRDEAGGAAARTQDDMGRETGRAERDAGRAAARREHENGRASTPLRAAAALGVVLAVHFGIQYLTRVLAVWPHLPLPDELGGGSWVQAFDHHLWQMALALLLIGALGRGRWSEWGLTLRNREESLRLLRRFVVVYGGYFIGIGFVVQLLLVDPAPPAHPMTPLHVTGQLAFGFLFVGVSEEILFRGLFQTWLARTWTGTTTWLGLEIPNAGLAATFVFVVAHVGFTLRPLALTHLYWPQLVMAAVLGVFYSVAYHRTGSLLAPILAHNFSDGALWASEYVLWGLKG